MNIRTKASIDEALDQCAQLLKGTAPKVVPQTPVLRGWQMRNVKDKITSKAIVSFNNL
jgi:hypothetical protein